VPPAVITAELRAYTKDYCDDVIERMLKGYDSPPKDSYVRTGRYGDNMVARNTSSGAGIQYTIVDGVQDKWGRYYAGYVGGFASTQASFHIGRWPSIANEMKRKNFDRGVQRIITTMMRGL
jgi:hypothetical protein